MGSSKRKRESFLAKHKFCAFCGGGKTATSIEHCPPRAMFQGRQWPEGFEFPACDACNFGSSNEDVLVAVLARMDPFENSGNEDGTLEGLMHNVNRQYPDFFKKMMPTATEARRQNRRLGIKPAAGLTQQEAGPLKIPEEAHKAVCVFSGKLAKAIFYLETGKIFPDSGCLLLHWFTNAELFKEGKYPVFEHLKELQGNAPQLQRGKTFLNNQFQYKISISPEHDIFILQALFGKSFGFVVFGSPIQGKLEASFEQLRKQKGRDGPFEILQSSAFGR